MVLHVCLSPFSIFLIMTCTFFNVFRQYWFDSVPAYHVLYFEREPSGNAYHSFKMFQNVLHLGVHV